jgi:hypothetical protein
MYDDLATKPFGFDAIAPTPVSLSFLTGQFGKQMLAKRGSIGG